MDKILVPKLGKSYVSFKKELLLWQDVTSLEEGKRAAAIVLSLPDRAKQVALQISRTELKNGVERQVNGEAKKITGVERLTEELDKIYMEDVEKERYQAYADFRNFSRGSSMSIHEYLLEFDKRVKMLKEYKIELPESVLAYELLNSANLSSEKIALARATVDKLDYDSMCDQIKKITIDKHPSETLHEDFKIKVEKDDQTLYADTTQEAEEKTYTLNMEEVVEVTATEETSTDQEEVTDSTAQGLEILDIIVTPLPQVEEERGQIQLINMEIPWYAISANQFTTSL